MAVDPKIQSVEESSVGIMNDVFGPIINRGVELGISSVENAEMASLLTNFMETPVVVEAPLEGAIAGKVFYIFTQKLAAGITDLMVMGDGTAPFNEQESLDGISEASNQIVGALATGWTVSLGAEVRPSGASAKLLELESLSFDPEDYYQVDYKITIEGWGEEVFTKLVPKSMNEVLSQLMNPDESAEPAQVGASPEGAGQAAPEPMPNVQRASFASFDDGQAVPGMAEPKNLSLLLDISLPVTIELGRTSMLIKDVLELGPGSVIELNKLSGEPVDLYVNDKKFALGEVVVIDENFGIRITELLQIEDRLKAIRN